MAVRTKIRSKTKVTKKRRAGVLDKTSAAEKRIGRLQRTVQLVVQLNAGNGESIESISQRFSISERTVYRDLQLIRAAGLPLTIDSDRGYVFSAQRNLPCPELELQELTALLMAGKALAGSIGDPYASLIQGALEKISAATCADLRAEAQQVVRLVSNESQFNGSLESSMRAALILIRNRELYASGGSPTRVAGRSPSAKSPAGFKERSATASRAGRG